MSSAPKMKPRECRNYTDALRMFALLSRSTSISEAFMLEKMRKKLSIKRQEEK